ncbi:hypothetical protein [Dolichospermum phage Dfl-JY45]
MGAIAADSVLGNGAPIRLLPPYDARFARIFRAVIDAIDAGADTLPPEQRVVQMFPGENGTLSVFLDFADGGSVGMVVPPGFWQLHAASVGNVTPH